MAAPALPASSPWPRRLTASAATVATVSAALYLLAPDLVRLFLPVRAVVLGGLGVSAGLVAIALWRGGRTTARLGLAALVVVAAAAVHAREYGEYGEVEVAVENEGARLVGTLYVPDGPGPHPAVVIAPGSLRAPRRLYHLWADRLARTGVAVVSLDKRGTGQSGGVYEADNNASVENLTLLASDVGAALRLARARPDVDPARVGILGISMGGWLGPMAAARDDSVAFMVVVSGTPVSVGEEGVYSDLTGEGHGDGAGLSRAEVDRRVAAQAPSGFDPRPTLRALDVPTLWLLGAEDSSVPTVKSTAVLDSLIADGRPFRYVVYPGAEHLGLVMRWPFDLAPGYWDDLTAWATAAEPR